VTDLLTPRKAALLAALRAGQAGPPSDRITSGGPTGTAMTSYAQRQMWYLNRLAPGEPTYLVPVAYRLRGRLDESALAWALDTVLERHAPLRTSLRTEGDEPVQVVRDAEPGLLHIVDLTGVPRARREAQVRARLTAQADTPVDLARDPVLRASLLRCAPDDHVLLLTFHHAAIDEWSLRIFNEELGELYAARLAGRTPVLAEPPIAYGDYAAWQHEWLGGPEAATQLEYWRDRLAGAPAVLDLPVDRTRPAEPSVAGAVRTFPLDVPQDALRELCQRFRVTLYMVTLAAFQVLLARYTGQRDIVVGAPVANRQRAETDAMIGLFVNTVAIRCDLADNPSFAELLGRVRSAVLDANQHQDLPFEKLIETLRPVREPGHSPLVQVMFLYGDQPAPPRLTDVSAARIDVPLRTAKFDLTLGVRNTAGELTADIEYRTDLFDDSTVERIAGHFHMLLGALLADPTVPVGVAPLLTAGELDQLRTWSRGAATGPAATDPVTTAPDSAGPTPAEHAPVEPVHTLIAARTATNPHAPAVVDEAHTLSYAELDTHAEALAGVLHAHGVGVGGLVAILVERRTELAVAVLAVLKAGAAYVPLDPSNPAARLRYVLDDTAAPVVLTSATLRRLLPETAAALIDVTLDAAPGADDARAVRDAPAPGPDDLAYVIYTSGSTGQPKGVMVTHRGVTNYVTWAAQAYQVGPGDVVPLHSSIAFDLTVTSLLVPLAAGATVRMLGEQFGPQGLGEALRGRSGPFGLVKITPAQLELVNRQVEPAEAPGRTRCFVIGGENLRADQVALWREHAPDTRLINEYGPTEAVVGCVVYEVDSATPDDGSVPIGRPIANTELYVLDEWGNQVPIGVVGELYIGGAGLARGYLNRPDLTAERFVRHPFRTVEGARLYRTGDLVRYRPDGNLEYLGRTDSQVKVRGYRVECGEVEAAIGRQLPAAEVAVVPRGDTPQDRRLVGYVAGVAPDQRHAEPLREALRSELPPYMIPSAIVFLDALPVTGNGKLDVAALPAESAAPDRPAAPAATPAQHPTEALPPAAGADFEQLIVEVWREVLDPPHVDVDDNFFDLGGHSLRLLAVHARLCERLGDVVSLTDLFRHPTVRSLSMFLRQMVDAATLPGTSAPVVAPIPRAEPDAGPAPLSSGQHRLWFLDRVYDELVYTTGSALRLDGDLDVDVLRTALSELVRRHEALRTIFPTGTDGDPVQVVLPVGAIDLPVVEVPADRPVALAGTAAGRDPVHAALLAEIHRPFDLASGPLFRPVLFRLAPDRHILSMTMHHNVTDGWSLGVINTEVAALYNAFLAGQPSPLPELAIQYHDFARWQRARLAAATTADSMRYWLRQLDGAATMLDLPTDHPRPPVQTFTGAVSARVLGQPLTEGLRQLGQQAGATLYMTLLAAFQTLLFRYSGQRDICVGTPVAGRVRTELEPMVGFFVNMLVLRTELDGGASFADLLTQVRRTALEAYDHQEVPFERVVDALKVPRDLSRNPLFQVMFNLLNIPDQGDLRMSGLRVTEIDVEPEIAQQDLALYAYEVDEGLRLRLEYNCALFEPATAEQLMEHLETLLTAVVADPSVRLSEVDLLTPADLHRQVVEWNETARPMPDRTLAQLFERQVDTAPARPAVTFENTTLSYAELNARANVLAHRLRKAGVGPDTPVAVSLERSERLIVALLGILKAGGAYVPVDPSYPIERRRYVLDDSRAAVLVTEESLAGQFPEFAGELLFCDGTGPGSKPSGSGPAKTNPEPLTTPDHLAYVIYTSGSTGRPKGVRIRQAGLVNVLMAMREKPGIGADDNMLAMTSYAFDMSVPDLFLPLVVGARIVMASRDVAYDATRLTDLLDAEGVTLMQATPATWRLLIASGWAGRPGLRAICGGEAVPAPLARDLAERVYELWNMYGPTEATVWATAERIERGAPEVTIGRPLANSRVYLLDAAMRPVPVGVVGELYLGGTGLARDYLGQPELTAERFVADPFGDGRLYRTGDLGRYRRDGRIEFLGRNDSQVKVHGYRIELGEIESLLQRHPAVRASAVVVREDAGEPVIVAYLSPRPDTVDGTGGDETTGSAPWRTYLRTYLPDYMVPVAFVVLDALPLTTNRKVDRNALPAWRRGGEGAGGAAPQTPLQRALVARWAEVLGYETVGIDDDFFDLGGDSFKAIKALRGLETPISVLDLFRHTTIRSLTGHVESSAGSDDRLLHELTASRPGVPTTMTLVCVPFAGGGAATFRPLAEAMPGGVSLYALERPGHDLNRVDEPQLSMDEIVTRCVAEVVDGITGPVVVYGHCVGGAIAVELARRLEAAGVDLVNVVIGAHFPAPRLPGRLSRWRRRWFPAERWTSKRVALENLRALGFFTDVLDKWEKELVMLVALSDWTIGEDYYTDVYADGLPDKLRAPIVCVIGEGDRSTELFEERYLEWEFFSDSVSLEVIEGAGHYFAKHQAVDLAEIIFRTAERDPAAAVAEPTAAATQPEPAPSPDPLAAAPQAPTPGTRPTTRPAQTSLSVFYRVAFGQLVSLIGSGLTSFGMGLWVFQRTGSVTLFATAAVLALLPAVALSPIAGAVADRWNRRLIMVFADTLAASGTVGLGLLLWLDRIQLWHIFTAITITAVSSAFQQPAYLAAVTQLVPKRYYGRANGMVSLGGATSILLAPLLGGALVSTIGLRGIIVIDLLTFAVAVTITLSVRFPDLMFKRREESFGREVSGGFRFIMRRHSLLAMILLTTLLNYFFAMVEVLATPLTLSFGDPSVLGVVLGASGVGLLLGSIVMSVWGGLERRAVGILASVLLLGVALLTVGLRPSPVFPALGLFGMGLATALVNTHWLSIVQTKVGLELQGRVMSTGIMLSWLMVPAGFLSAAPLVDNVFGPLAANGSVAAALSAVVGDGPGRGIAVTTVVAGLCTLLLGAAGFAYRPIRRLDEVLPDAETAAVILRDKDRLQALVDRHLAEAQRG
jgi:amino acid adenylation domain-containing protein